MTPAQQSTFTEVLIEESGGDSSKVSTSHATADRARRGVGQLLSSLQRFMASSKFGLSSLGFQTHAFTN